MIKALNDKFYTVKELSEILNLSPDTIRGLFYRGLRRYRVGRTVYIPETGVIDFFGFDEMPAAPPPPAKPGPKPKKRRGNDHG